MNTRSRLEFALGFAQEIDLKNIRQGDLMNLREDISAFFGLEHLTPLKVIKDQRAYSGLKKCDIFPLTMAGEDYWLIRKEDESLFSIPVGRYPHQLTVEELSLLQKETLVLLETAIENEETHEKLPTSQGAGRSINIIKDKVSYEISVIKRIFWPGKKKHSQIHIGGTHELFLSHLAELLIETDPSLICKCPECGKIFYRVRKQQYCSRKCTNRVLFQRYLDNHGERLLKVSLQKSKTAGGQKRKQHPKK